MSGQAGTESLAPIRASVRALCADFPGEYWRKLDRERGYPTEFVAAEHPQSQRESGRRPDKPGFLVLRGHRPDRNVLIA